MAKVEREDSEKSKGHGAAEKRNHLHKVIGELKEDLIRCGDMNRELNQKLLEREAEIVKKQKVITMQAAALDGVVQENHNRRYLLGLVKSRTFLRRLMIAFTGETTVVSA